MGKLIRGPFGKPRKPVSSSLKLDLDHFTLTVDGEDWIAYVLNGELVGAVPIEPGTAPEPRKLARVIEIATRRLTSPSRSAPSPEP